MRTFSHRLAGLGNVAVLTAMVLLSGLATRAGEVYTVRRNDTLTAIAEKYGTTVVRLASHNGLSSPDKIHAGQRLRIPGSATLPPDLEHELDETRIRSGRWKYIVIHHSATDMGSAKGMDEYHSKIRHMENGLAYHFVIGNGRGMDDGEIAVGRRWTEQLAGGHLASESQNEVALGICLVGNFDRSRPTEKQIESLTALTGYLIHRCKLPVKAVQSHQHINVIHTRCPGSHFPMDEVLENLKSASQ